MATATVILPVDGAAFADGSSNNAYPAIGYVTSSDATNPKLRLAVADFDDTTDEQMAWAFRLPADYASGGTVKLQFWMASATSGNVVWSASLQAVTPGDSTDMESLDTDGEGGGWSTGTEAVPGTAGYLDEASISPGMDSAAAGDLVALHIRRDADNASDTATGDARLCAVALQYTTA